MLSDSREVLSALRDQRFSAGYIDWDFREGARAALASEQVPFDDDIFCNLSGEVDLISELAATLVAERSPISVTVFRATEPSLWPPRFSCPRESI